MTDHPNRLSTPPVVKPVSLDEQLRAARENFEKAFKEFHENLKLKVLRENQSEAHKRQEKYIIDQLVKACVQTDRLNMGEGVMAVAVVALREHLTIRNRVNELEYQIEDLKKQVNHLKKELGIEK